MTIFLYAGRSRALRRRARGVAGCAEIAAAIIDDQREMNWTALPEWKEQAALYRLLRRKVGRETAQGIVRAVVVDMASESVRAQ